MDGGWEDEYRAGGQICGVDQGQSWAVQCRKDQGEGNQSEAPRLPGQDEELLCSDNVATPKMQSPTGRLRCHIDASCRREQ